MSRARATALALVNWKGVFYERYQLDRRVTALEGANGAGKTTVMIAAYVVLLPDMSRLRFTNLGETAATGGDRGIWGRLGEPTRPAYAALEVSLGEGNRLVLGVLLARKSEPTVELTPFLISGLDAGVRLQDLLLVVSDDEECVPELAELRSNVAAQGAKLEVFASAKDYFAALFELGIGALRLGNDEDRGRLADMLRTSMTGGISRAITSDLRSFLLREQGSIGDTLGRMRENLNACRRTRIEVGEAQLLEQEISGVYEAGQGMFAAALQATRALAREQEEAVTRASERLAASSAAQMELERSRAGLEARAALLAERLKERRALLEALRERARRLASLETLHGKRQEVLAERELADAQATEARAAQEQASRARDAAKRAREAAHDAQQRAALGLADLQAGLDELHRRSSAHRQAQRALAEVGELHGETRPDAEELEQLLAQSRARSSELDQERLLRERALTLAAERAREWQQALGALEQLGASAEPATAFETARAVLRRLDLLEAGAGQRARLSAELERVLRVGLRQKAAEQAALELGLQLTRGGMLERIQNVLAATTEELEQLEAQQRELEGQRRGVNAALGARSEQLARAQADLGQHRRLLEKLARIEPATGPLAPAREALLRARDSLGSERQELGARLAQWSATRERLLREANQYEGSGGQFPAELLKLRDELDGELLGNRFEELDLHEASRLEALLGPLAHAIVVDDVAAAAERLRDKPRELGELRLIAAGTELEFLRAPQHPENTLDLCVAEGPALRITRRPERATLGRKAREARIAELRRQALEMGGQLEQLQLRASAVKGALEELDAILPFAELLERGDPDATASALSAEQRTLTRDELSLTQSIDALSSRANQARQLASRQRALLSEAFLLDAADHEHEASQLAEQLAEVERAAEHLTQTAEPRRRLAALLDALRSPPPSSEQLERYAGEQRALDAERDRLFRLQEAVAQLQRALPALGWHDAEPALQNHEQVAPALEEQHRRARAQVQDEERAVQAAEAAWELATRTLQEREARATTIAAHAEQLAREHADLGLGDELAPASAALELGQLTQELEQLELEERRLLGEQGAQHERARQLAQAVEAATRELSSARRDSGPAGERWQALRAEAEAAGVLHSGEASEQGAPHSSLALSAQAQSRAELLRDRLSAARGAEALTQELSPVSAAAAHELLGSWLEVRKWLARRVPAQVAQVDDPLLALERLQGHLSLLEQRLGHQEADLRGASEDVARGIEVQLRRAKAQVRRLNQNLNGVRFGSIAGIRVELRRAQQMEPVLRALAEGSAQELLFQSNLPTEEALSEVLRRFGGGARGGARVLDYREYLELLVEVQRKADGAWEPANPTRLSTGEAIGVGAALMMVVLAEWERDANLLRARRGAGSLRFLFLDEANRLSQDNLGSLFDLCESLDLQLLIAAPEVARAEGCTTYRLVRKVTEDGREEVIVSGRRALGADPLAGAAPAAPVQGTLFEN